MKLRPRCRCRRCMRCVPTMRPLFDLLSPGSIDALTVWLSSLPGAEQREFNRLLSR